MTPTVETATTWVGVGSSSERDGLLAGRLAAEHARDELGQQRIDLALLFASSRLDQAQLLRGVREVVGNTPLVGGSDAGEILDSHPLDRSAVIMLVTSDHMHLTVSAQTDVGKHPREAGQRLAQACIGQTTERRRALLMFSDGITGANHELLRGVRETLGISFPILGALTGDDLRFAQTYQYCNDRVLTDSVVGCLISGQVIVGASARHGWNPVGHPRRVTRCNGSILHQLDDAPAARVYEEFLSPEELKRMQAWLMTQATIRYPLGMSVEGEEELLLRNVLRVTPDGSLICAGNIMPDSSIQFMVGTRQTAIDAARVAAKQARETLQHVEFALLFDSVARRRLFGRQAHEELEAIRAELGMQVPLIGCYTYGEQAPLRSAVQMGRSYFHNETALVIAVGT